MGGHNHGRNHQMVVVYGIVFITLQFQWVILNIFTWHLRTFFFGLQIGSTYIWAYRSALGATKWDGLLLEVDHKQRSVCWVNRLSGYTSCQGEASWYISPSNSSPVSACDVSPLCFFRLRPERLKKHEPSQAEGIQMLCWHWEATHLKKWTLEEHGRMASGWFIAIFVSNSQGRHPRSIITWHDGPGTLEGGRPCNFFGVERLIFLGLNCWFGGSYAYHSTRTTSLFLCKWPSSQGLTQHGHWMNVIIVWFFNPLLTLIKPILTHINQY